jgi:hypothetical protein
VPFYLYPRNPLPSAAQIYDGHPWLLGPTRAFGQETAVHALRLMASGLFDAHPRLQIILGHMGEGLPYSMWRVDNRNAWTRQPPRYPAKRKLGEYFQENFYLTTSGNFRTQTLIDAMLEIGVERITFSTDWPFENIDHAAAWFDAAAISEADRLKIGRTNALRLVQALAGEGRAELRALLARVLRADHAEVVGTVVHRHDLLLAQEHCHRVEALVGAAAVPVVNPDADRPAVLARAHAAVLLEHDLRLAAELDDGFLGVGQADAEVAADLLAPALRLRAVVHGLHLIAPYGGVAAQQRRSQEQSKQNSRHGASLAGILEYRTWKRTSATPPTPASPW